jgi:Holliday junction resolvase RusA-like endonuclease
MVLGKPVPYVKKRWHPKPQADQMQAIAKAARQARLPFITGGVNLVVRAYFEPPKSVTVKGRRTKISDEHRESMVGQPAWHIRPDLTNIMKLAEDALKGITWADDCQVVSFNGSGKWYSWDPRTEISVASVGGIEYEIEPRS